MVEKKNKNICDFYHKSEMQTTKLFKQFALYSGEDGANHKKILAFSGSDLKESPDFFLKKIQSSGYSLLALDVKAIELASISNLPYTIINDWLDTKMLHKIRDIAWEFENNWYKPVQESFTSSGICWPEFDHDAMNNFWLDVITSYVLVDTFRDLKIEELMIIKQEIPVPMVYRQGNGVYKIIWENEMSDVLNIINVKRQRDDKKSSNNPSNRLQYLFNKKIEFQKLLKRGSSQKNLDLMIKKGIENFIFFPIDYLISSLSSFITSYQKLTGKIVFFASDTELSRSKDLIHDLIMTFPGYAVIISQKREKLRGYQITKKLKIPAITVKDNYRTPSDIKEKFLNGYQELLKSKNKALECKIFTLFQFHFYYYCQFRWPTLDREFNDYLNLFSQCPPKILIGASVNRPNWLIPILAAKRCGIKTLSIPHAVGQVIPTEEFPLTIKNHLFDFELCYNEITKKYLNSFCTNNKSKKIICKNCTDTYSHQGRFIKPNYPQKSWNVLVVFTPTTYMNPNIKYPPIYPYNKNPKIQMDIIRKMQSPPKDFKEKISIKFKVHPYSSELELFYALGRDTFNALLPVESELQPILNETDIVIGANYNGSVITHALLNLKPVVLLNNDKLFDRDYKGSEIYFSLFNNSIKYVHTIDELWDLIRRYFTDPSFAEEMKKDVSIFAKEYLDNSNYPTIGCILEEILKNEKDDY